MSYFEKCKELDFDVMHLDLNENWTWNSFNNQPEDLNISSILSNAPGVDLFDEFGNSAPNGLIDGPVTYVKDQSGSATYYDGYGWYPGLGRYVKF